MNINGRNVTGIKDAVGYVRNTPADRWAITLDMSDWSVQGHELIGQDFLQCHWPTIEIMGGHGNDGWGRENPKINDVKAKVDEVMTIRAHAKEEFERGCYHPNSGFSSAEEEGWISYFGTELTAAGF